LISDRILKNRLGFKKADEHPAEQREPGEVRNRSCEQVERQIPTETNSFISM
jgi:hypothetical protein